MDYITLLTKLNQKLNPIGLFVSTPSNIQETKINSLILDYEEGELVDRDKVYQSYKLYLYITDFYTDYQRLFRYINTIMFCLSYLGALNLTYRKIEDTDMEGRVFKIILFEFKMPYFISNYIEGFREL